MLWIKAVEMVETMDDLNFSRSVKGTLFSDGKR